MNYLFEMAKQNWKQVLWANVQSRMNALYGKENLTRLIKESHVGPGTVTRIKDQETSVGVDVLEKVATALKVEPWQLLHPTLGNTNAENISNHALVHDQQAPVAINGVATLDQALETLTAYLGQLDPAMRGAAGALLAAIAQQPDNPAPLASLTALLAPAAFAQPDRKAA